jgi:HD-GYP domain-containing protein (c-di-GMP phosphodiesterase class II)
VLVSSAPTSATTPSIRPVNGRRPRVAVPAGWLGAPSPERELVHAHPSIGAQILRNVSMLQGAGLDVVRHHHERWDGAGYPDGLFGTQIPLSARIFAVADTLDAMTSDRPYRAALEWADAVGEIQAQSGRQFDPKVVQAFASEEESLPSVYEDLSLVA